jgi:hypothetical protein
MEFKLARNQEIRRKVVGHVLDASALWELSLSVKLVALSHPRYLHPKAEILVPETYGDEAQVSAVRGRVAGTGIPWHEPRFFGLLAGEHRPIAKALLEWIESRPALTGAKVP